MNETWDASKASEFGSEMPQPKLLSPKRRMLQGAYADYHFFMKDHQKDRKLKIKGDREMKKKVQNV